MDLCLPITKRHLVSFTYDGHERVAVPAAYGCSTAGNDVLRAYQTGGTSSTRVPPFWSLFDVDKITDLSILEEEFSADPPDYHRDDKNMSMIYCQL